MLRKKTKEETAMCLQSGESFENEFLCVVITATENDDVKPLVQEMKEMLRSDSRFALIQVTQPLSDGHYRNQVK